MKRLTTPEAVKLVLETMNLPGVDEEHVAALQFVLRARLKRHFDQARHNARNAALKKVDVPASCGDGPVEAEVQSTAPGRDPVCRTNDEKNLLREISSAPNGISFVPNVGSSVTAGRDPQPLTNGEFYGERAEEKFTSFCAGRECHSCRYYKNFPCFTAWKKSPYIRES